MEVELYIGSLKEGGATLFEFCALQVSVWLFVWVEAEDVLDRGPRS